MLEKSSFLYITRPTRVTKCTATLIDNTFVCCKLQNRIRSDIVLHDISDHFPSIVTIEGILAKKREQVILYTRDITDCKVQAVQEELSSINWPAHFMGKDVNDCYEIFHSILSDALNMHLPIREIKIPAKWYICEP